MTTVLSLRRQARTLAYRTLAYPHLDVTDDLAALSPLPDVECSAAFNALCDTLRTGDGPGVEHAIDVLLDTVKIQPGTRVRTEVACPSCGGTEVVVVGPQGERPETDAYVRCEGTHVYGPITVIRRFDQLAVTR